LGGIQLSRVRYLGRFSGQIYFDLILLAASLGMIVSILVGKLPT
jgi:hypothetical protein